MCWGGGGVTSLIGPDCFWQNRTWVEHFLAEVGHRIIIHHKHDGAPGSLDLSLCVRGLLVGWYAAQDASAGRSDVAPVPAQPHRRGQTPSPIRGVWSALWLRAPAAVVSSHDQGGVGLWVCWLIQVERILNPVILDTARHWAKEYRAAIANSSRPTLESWITETGGRGGEGVGAWLGRGGGGGATPPHHHAGRAGSTLDVLLLYARPGVAWGGDLHTVADAFSGGFWFLDQLGMLAQEGVVVQHRHTVYAYNIQVGQPAR